MVIGVMLLIGCIPLPAPYSPVKGRDASREVGKANSRKPIRIGATTGETVRQLLGTPYFTSDDGNALAYHWSVRNGVVVWPFCFYAHPVNGERTLVLRFNKGGILSSCEVLKADEPVVQLTSIHIAPPLPLDLREQRAERQRRYWEQQRQQEQLQKPETAPR